MDWQRIVALIIALAISFPVITIGLVLVVAAGEGVVRFVMAMFGYR